MFGHTHTKQDLFSASIVAFPSGAPVKETQIGLQQVSAVSKGHALKAEPLKNFAVGILDPVEGKITAAFKLPVVDMWDDAVAGEGADGNLFITQIAAKTSKEVPLPLGPLPEPRAVQFSPDGKYLIVSVTNRAAIWNVDSGKQGILMRPMRSAWIDDGDRLYGQMTKHLDNEPIEIEVTLDGLAGKDLGKYETQDWQYHDLHFRYKPLGKDNDIHSHATFEVKKMGTQEVAWSRDFPHESPACWSAEGDRMVLAWDLSSDTAKSEIKSHPQLQHEVEMLKDRKKGLLLETVVPLTGAPLQQVIIPEADLTHGLNDQRQAIVSGDLVLVRGEHGNTTIYSLESGAKVGEFFGFTVASDATAGVVAAENREEEILFVDEHSGKELQRFTLGSPVRAARIVGDQEKMLLVVTADQVVHRLPLPK